MPCLKDWVSITCPKCKTNQTIFVYKVADVKEEPDLKDKLLHADINITPCIKCKQRLHYDEYMLYSDRDKGLLVNVYSRDYKNRINELTEGIYKQLVQLPIDEMVPNYIVFGFQALAQSIGMVEHEIKDKKPAELASWEADDYRRIFILSEEWFNVRKKEDYEEKLPAADDAMSIALEAHQAGNFQKAVELYEAIIQDLPDYFPAVFNLGLLCFGEIGDLDKAKACFELCRALRPNDSEVLFGLGQIYLKLKEPEKAVPCFYHAIAAAPQRSLAWFNLGLGLAMVNSKTAGLEALERSLELSSNKDDRNLIARTIRTVTEKM